MKKRMTSLLVVLCLVFALIPTALAASASDFPDVKKGTWYYDAVDEVVSNGYFLGQGDGTFAPHKAMTRAMFVTVLSRVDGAVVDNSKSSFSDVPAGAWYTGAVTWAAQNSIVLGVGGDKFDPNRNINRVDMCLIMSRYISYYAAKTGRVPAVSGVVKTFGDTASLSASNKEAVEKCVSYGLIVGDDYGNFKPASNATRAEVAVIISRLAWITTGGGGTGVYNRYYRNYPGGGDSEWTQMYLGTVQGWAAVSANAGWTEPDGYTFDGWNTKPDGSGTDYAVGQPASRLFLYAQWKPLAVDHINVAMDKAVDYANTEINSLYDKAYDDIAELLDGSSVLNDVKAFKEGTTFDLVLTDHTIDVTFKTDLSNDNPSLKAMVNFAVNYAKEVYASETTKQDVKDLATKVEEHLKTLLKELGVEYEGSTMRQKLTAAAKSLAELGKGKAVAYRDELKKIFKNVDLKNLNEVAKSNGTTSVLGVTVSANDSKTDTVLLEVKKDNTPTRADLEDAAQKAHGVVQTATGDVYTSIDDIAKKITGKLVFEPAEAIAQNYKAAGGDYDAEYTVKFHVTTGTGNYLQYKFDGQYDHFRFAPTQGMWNTYVDTLNKVKSQVVSTLTNKNNPTAAGPAAAAAPYAAFSARFIGFTAPIAGDPSTVANADGKMSLVDMIDKIDEAFKELNGPEDETVKEYMKQWKEDNKDKLSEDDMIDILIGEKELDTENLNNDAMLDMVDDLVAQVARSEKVSEEVNFEDDNVGWTADDVASTLRKARLPERVKDVLDAVDDYGMTDFVNNALADEFNSIIEEQYPENATTPEFQANKKAAADNRKAGVSDVQDVFKDAIKDQLNDTEGLIKFADQTLDIDVEQKVQDALGPNVSLDDVTTALKLFEDAQNPEALVLKTLGGAVDSMDSEVIKKVVEKRWENYSARVDRVLTRIDNALTRVLNSRFGDTVEGATIQIGEKGNVIKVSDLQKILRDDYSTYAKLVNALHTFVYETANIGDLSIKSLANTLITVSAGKYTYSFYVEIDLSKVA